MSVWASSSATASSGSPMCFHALTAARQWRSMQLEHGRLQPASGHPGDGRAAGRQGLEEADDGAGGGRAGRPQPHRHLGDHTERALRADHQPDQVVARHTLRGAPPEAHDLPGRRDHFQRQHVVARHPVLHAAQPTGVGGDVAADRRQRGAAPGRVGTTGRARRPPRADRRSPRPVGRPPAARRVDLDDRAHPFGAQHHAPVHRVRAPRKPVPAPRGTTGTPCRAHTRTTSATSAVLLGRATASGTPKSAQSATSRR